MRPDVQKRLALLRGPIARPEIGELLHERPPVGVGRGEDLDGDGAKGVVELRGEQDFGCAGETHFERETEGGVGALVVECYSVPPWRREGGC
jgi:hypothetical protein